MMNLRRIAVPLLILALLAAAWHSLRWQGLMLVAGGVLMWALLHFTRLTGVMQKAVRRPIGHVASAVMLNARLHQGASLLHVVALTRSLGQQLSAQGCEPEIYLWQDAGGSQVRCEFERGRLARWHLERPQAAGEP